MNLQTIKCKDMKEIAEYAATFIWKQAENYIRSKGYFTLVLSGGQTPKTLYKLLSGPGYKEKFNWREVYIFWGDERYVSKSHFLSNYKMALDSLLLNVPLPKDNIFPIPGPDESESTDHASQQYEQTIKEFFDRHGELKDLPSFDIVLLGMGGDGHTASLYPVNTALREEKRWVVAVDAPDYEPVRKRITLTLPVLNSAKHVLFMVSGENKRNKLNEVIWEMKNGNTNNPASLIQPEGDLYILTDTTIEDM